MIEMQIRTNSPFLQPLKMRVKHLRAYVCTEHKNKSLIGKGTSFYNNHYQNLLKFITLIVCKFMGGF